MSSEEVGPDRIQPVEELRLELRMHLREVLPLPAESARRLDAAARRGQVAPDEESRAESASVRPQPRQTSSPLSISALGLGARARARARTADRRGCRAGRFTSARRCAERWRFGLAARVSRLSDQRRCQSWKTNSVQSCLAVVAAPRHVLCEQTLHLRTVEDPLTLEARRRTARRAAARAAGPLNHSAIGIPKPFFGRPAIPGGKHVGHRALQQVLRIEAPQLEPWRHAAQERRRGRRRGRARGPRASTPCSRGRPSRGCRPGDRSSRRHRSAARAARRRRSCIRRTPLREGIAGLVCRGGATARPVENEPSQAGCRTSGGRAAPRTKRFSLKSKLKLPVETGSRSASGSDEPLVQRARHAVEARRHGRPENVG